MIEKDKKAFKKWLVSEIDEMLKFGKGVDLEEKFIFNLKVKYDKKTTQIQKKFHNSKNVRNN